MTGGTTVAALLTPLAPGAIAVIGLAGPRVDEILAAILRASRGDRPPQLQADQPVFRRLADGDEVLEDVVVARRTRDGTTVAEINSHGGVRIVQRILALLARHGATIIDGLGFHEMFSADGPIQRDIDRALLRSTSRRLTVWLLRQRSILPDYLAGVHRLTSGEIGAFRDRSEAAIRLLGGIHIALVGPPNSGKSTLANRLVGKDRIITSARPGTTRDWVSETALIQGWPVTLTDTAGLRRTTCPIETEAIRRGRAQVKSADVMIVVLDATAGEQELQQELDAAVGLVEPAQASIVALNKSDLRAAAIPALRSQARSDSSIPDWVVISALTGDGMPALEARVASLVGLDLLHDDLPTAILQEHLQPCP